jgi:RNA polymerase sigma-70 factor (ECF subfamily)
MGDRPEAGQTDELLGRVAAGDAAALDELMAGVRPFMRRVVEVRIDPRLRARIDPSDVVQETLVEATRRIRDFLDRRPLPFHLWVRQMAFENLIRLRRFHVGAGKRAVGREFHLPEDSSVALGRQVLARGPGPLEGLIDGELAERVRQAVTRLPDTDREVLLMRSFEGLSNHEVAQALGLETSAASQRFGRAVLRLRKLLTDGDPPEDGDDRAGT